MTDPQKKSNWNELAEQIGAAPPLPKAPDPTPKKPVEAATPPPPPKRPPAPVKKSGWGAIASLLGIESAPPVEETTPEQPAAETGVNAPQAAPPAAAPSTPAVVQPEPEPIALQDDGARHREDVQPQSDILFTAPGAADLFTESSSVADESLDSASDLAEEPSVGSRGSSRGRRRREDLRGSDTMRDEAADAAREPVARTAPSAAEPSAGFADDDDPLVLRDTFVDEVEISFDDLTDSIDNAEGAPPVEAEEERPRKRRRRGRRRGRRDSGSTSVAGEETAATPAGADDGDRVSEDRVSEALADDLASEGEAGAAGDVGGAKPEANEGTTRKRRRGRRRRGGKREESAADAAKTPETTAASPKTGSAATPPTSGEPDDDDYDDAAEMAEFDAGDENGEADSRHRKIPTWSDAIGNIVDKNLASRSKNSNAPRRGRGGRGRQGDRSSK